MMGLTHRERDLLAFLAKFMSENNGVAPSFDEIGEYLGLKGKSGIHRILTALEERGHIIRMPNRARAIEIVNPHHSELAQFSDAAIAAEYALRFPQISQAPSGRLEGRAPDLNHGAQSGAAGRYAAPGEQMRAVSTPRRPSGPCPTPAPLGQTIHESRSFHAADNIERIQRDHV